VEAVPAVVAPPPSVEAVPAVVAPPPNVEAVPAVVAPAVPAVVAPAPVVPPPAVVAPVMIPESTVVYGVPVSTGSSPQPTPATASAKISDKEGALCRAMIRASNDQEVSERPTVACAHTSLQGRRGQKRLEMFRILAWTEKPKN
jgi:hypothetical protein